MGAVAVRAQVNGTQNGTDSDVFLPGNSYGKIRTIC
jgi:hypothetical protein